jgi:hypothetical protein
VIDYSGESNGVEVVLTALNHKTLEKQEDPVKAAGTVGAKLLVATDCYGIPTDHFTTGGFVPDPNLLQACGKVTIHGAGNPELWEVNLR